MKKIMFILVTIMALFILPENVEAKNKVIIYLFRGKTCEHCEEALNYINEHKDLLGENIEIKTYEVWKNGKNADLQTKVEEKLITASKDRGKVPFFVVGDYADYGYSGAATFNEFLEKAEEYVDSDEYKDVVEEVRSKNNIKAKALTLDDLFGEPNKIVTYIVFGVFGVIILGFVGMIVFSRK